MPQVTFIIPAYNAADYLRQAVKSILDQTCSDWKLIIVDDGSTDATPAIADACAGSDARISVIHHPAPSG
ncbi:MAG: glycosyltransferase, partial [Muribaculaceae bacterium]|nr:glycosyltransferase [Muribaculaceae bacterium]